jgi:N-acetylglucosamine-6-phosphate deacetylase
MNAYTNARIFTGDALLQNKAVLTDNGTVTGLVDRQYIPAGYAITDLQQRLLAPALMDIQIYGGNGKLFSDDPSPASIQACYEYCLGGGASQFYITIATNTMEIFYKGIDAVRAYWQAGGKGMPGLHLEGPYLNPVKKGAHIEAYIKKPTAEEVQQLLHYGRDVIKIMTLAPEQCDDSIIQMLQDAGVIVSAGHSNASYEQATGAFNKGIRVATHLFNAMSPLQHRAPGLVGAIYNHPSAMSSIVPDGIHVDFTAVRISKKIMQERLFIITDAVTPSTGGDYPHLFKTDRYTLPDGTLSGSALTMMKGVKNLVTHAGIAMEEALRMASLYPARVMHTDNRFGKIDKGFAAEFVVFDEDFNVAQVIVE